MAQPAATIETAHDSVTLLDGIPAHRIRASPRPGPATERDVAGIHDRENRLCELVDGVLVEKTVGFYESRLALVIGHLLTAFVDERRLGIVVGADGMMRLSPGNVRIPDAAFISWSRFPHRRRPSEPIPDVTPDLAVEMVSEGNTRREMERKLRDYFDKGVVLVWYVYPKSRTMRVFTSPAEFRVLREDDIVDGGTVLPGFSVPLREFFDRTGFDLGQ